MLQVDLGAVSGGPVETVGEVAPGDPVFADLEFALREPVSVSGRLMESGPGSYFWDARFRVELGLECRRCLAAVAVPIDQRVGLLFTEDEETDDPSAYPIPEGARELALAEVVREELILAAPRYPLCRDECRGLCARCGQDLNAGPCGCTPEPDSRWSALKGLERSAADE